MLQAFLTEELILALHQERVNAGVRAWLVSQVPKGTRDDAREIGLPCRWMPLNLRPANCR